MSVFLLIRKTSNLNKLSLSNSSDACEVHLALSMHHVCVFVNKKKNFNKLSLGTALMHVKFILPWVCIISVAC